MAKFPMDLSRFKKIAADKDCVTLKSSDGHEIKIALRALSPKARGQFAALPIHKADGGDSAEPSPTPTSDPNAPWNSGEKKDFTDVFNESMGHYIKRKFGFDKGGDVYEPRETLPASHPEKHQKGVHDTSIFKGGKGVSMSGEDQRSGLDVKPEHERVLSEMKSMPKPKLYAQGSQGVSSGDSAPSSSDDSAPSSSDDSSQSSAPQSPVTINIGGNGQDPTTALPQQPPAIPGGTIPLPAIARPGQVLANPGPVATTGVNLANPGPQQQQQQQDQDDGDQSQAGSDDQSSSSGQQAPDSSNPMAAVNKPAPQVSPPGSATPISPVQTPQQNYADMQADIRNKYLQEDQAWQHDLNNGHITPETYHDLFAKKSTLGQIGSIFGMLVGGIGSGLTHQPNMAFQMMDNEIQRDLDAQKQSKSNAQNLLNLTNQHELQKAQAANLGAQSNLTQAQANQESVQLSVMKANRIALQDQINKLKNMDPKSPEYSATVQAIGMMSSAVDAKNYGIASQLAATKMLLGQGPNGPIGGSGSDQAFAQRQRAERLSGDPKLVADADANEQRHIDGIPGLASRPIPEGIRNQVVAMNTLDAKGKDLLNYMNQNRGSVDPSVRTTAQQKLEELKNFYNGSIEGGALTEGRLGWYDKQLGKGYNPTSLIGQLLGSTAGLKEVVNSNSLRRDLLVKSVGLNPPKQQATPTSGGLQEGRTGTMKVVVKNGKWKPLHQQ